MMKKTSLWLLTLTLLFALTACGKQTVPPAAGGDAQQGDTTAPETMLPAGDAAEYTGELGSYYALLGKSEAEVDAILEGGEKNLSEDGATLLEASYSAGLLGENAFVEVIYGADLRVAGVSINLPEARYDAARADLEGDFGAPEEIDETKELETAYLRWPLDGKEISLSKSYGTTQIQMSLGA